MLAVKHLWNLGHVVSVANVKHPPSPTPSAYNASQELGALVERRVAQLRSEVSVDTLPRTFSSRVGVSQLRIFPLIFQTARYCCTPAGQLLQYTKFIASTRNHC